MGDCRHLRLLGAFALVAGALAPTIAFAKTLEGTGVTAGPSSGPLVVPPNSGAEPPMIVPPSAPPAIVSPSGEPGVDTDTENGGLVPEPQEVWAPVPSEPETPTALPTTGASVPAQRATPSALPSGPTLPGTGAAPTPATGTAGPSLLAPTALALRSQATAPPPSTGVNATNSSVASTIPTKDGVTTTAAVPIARSAAISSKDPCRHIPAIGSPDTMRVTGRYRAEVTDGRDLRASGAVARSVDASPMGTTSVFGYLLQSDAAQLIAVFQEDPARTTANPTGEDRTGGASNGGASNGERVIRALRVVRCNPQVADAGIAPGDYVIRYVLAGNTAESTPPLLSAALPIRVVAGPTSPGTPAGGALQTDVAGS